jgi:hypothetical protein
MPAARRARLAYGRPAGGDTRPPGVTYGLRSGLTSIARPKACSDQRLDPDTRRQLKAEVLLAAIDRSSLAR